MRPADGNTGCRATVAAFDFDGTLTRKDTFFAFLSSGRPPVRFAVDIVATFPLLMRYALRLVGNDVHKMAMFARQYRGVPVERFRAHARAFAEKVVPTLLRSEAVARMRFHQDQGHSVVIVTASIGDWIEPWALANGVRMVLASRAEVVDGELTGALQGANCHGTEKVARLRAVFPDRTAYTLFAYGDGHGDRELLASADFPFFRRFG